MTLQRLVAIMLTLSVWACAPAWAQTAPAAVPAKAASNVTGLSFPTLTGRVVDQANVIPADVEAQLTTQLAALEAKSSDQLVVATVPSLQGYEIEEYGYRLGRAWGIGQGERLNNGVILLVAPNERKVRIEVGYGLEGVLTDMTSGQIIRNAIVPAFKAGDIPGGIVAGVNEIEGILTLDPAELEARAKRGLDQVQPESDNVDPVAVIFVIIFIAFWILIVTRSARTARFRRTRRSGWDGAAMTTHDWHNDNVAADVAINVAGNILGSILSSGGGGGGGGGGGFSGGGGSFGGGGASGSW